MGTVNSDKSWKAYGKKNAYFGVLTHEEYLDDNLTEENKVKFFETGNTYVSEVYKIIHDQLDKSFSAASILDFGCGTGRLALAFAKDGTATTGLDVSEDMVAEAKINAKLFNLNNTSFHISDDQLSAISNKSYDLVNSYIVLQHINVNRGLKIFSSLIDKLNKGGIGVIQFTYKSNKTKAYQITDYIRYRVPLINSSINVLKGNPWNKPLMQMNPYDLNVIYSILQEKQIFNTYQQLENHGGYWGATIYFQKP